MPSISIRIALIGMAISGAILVAPVVTHALDAFTCYHASATKGSVRFPGVANPPGVGLVDQFGTSAVALTKPVRLCAPTDTTSGPPPATPDEHLEVYQAKSAVKLAKGTTQAVFDEFGTVYLDVLKPAELTLPSATDVNAPPSPLASPATHRFQCYKVKDRKTPTKFQPVTITVTDQFQTLQLEVKKPRRLCLPVDVNNQDPGARTAPDHLMCYQVKDLKQPAFAPVPSIFVANELGSETLNAKKPMELCVPARRCGTFRRKWGSSGAADGQFNQPIGIAFDQSGNVLVTDRRRYDIQKFTNTGVFLGKWGTLGSADGQFSAPISMVTNASGQIVVTDSAEVFSNDLNNNRVQVFTDTGVFVTKWGGAGSGNGQFNFPFGVGKDPSGNLYIADCQNDRVQKFTDAGIFAVSFGTSGVNPGQLQCPMGVGVDASGHVYVTELGNDRVSKFTESGTFVSTWAGFHDPVHVTADQHGRVYVADCQNHRIKVLTSDGELLTSWGGFGTGDGRLNCPKYVAIDVNEDIYVTDDNRRVQVFTCH